MKKLFTLLMTLVLVISLIPMTASAKAKPVSPPKEPTSSTSQNNGKDKNKGPGKGEHGKEDHGKKGHDKKGKKPAPSNGHDAANHTASGYGYDAKYHWIQYACGCRFNVESHVNPMDAEDDTCTCGYQFSDNADLVTLWVDGCPPIKNFNKNITEYKLNAHTYKDVKEIKIVTNTYHGQATVELPQDLTLKEGENKFEVKVIAENMKNSKIYTLIINKEAK